MRPGRLWAIFLALTLCAALLIPGGCGTSAAPVLAEASAAPAATPTASPTSAPTPTPTPTPDPALDPVTYAWISDTQGYASSYPETFLAMTQWIVDHQAEWNIQYVIHTGDVVNDMLRNSEWEAATEAMDVFVGKIPVIAIAGNHDIKGVVHDYTRFHELMLRQNYTSYPTFGGEEANGRRRYDLVTIGHDDFILIGVGYSIQRADIDWLNAVLAQYADRTAILLAHYYLNLDSSQPENDAALQAEVVAANPNVRYVLCGHKHGLRREEQTFDDDGDGTPDRTVEAIMGDYQGFTNGGEGYIVLLTFDPGLREIRVTAYSPIHDDYNYYDDETLETYTVPLSTVQDG